MKITDKEALKILKRINDIIPLETVDEYPDDEHGNDKFCVYGEKVTETKYNLYIWKK